MEKQKPRVGQTIDGFSRRTTRAHFYADEVLRPSQNKDLNKTVMPSLRPRPIPYSSTNPNPSLAADQSAIRRSHPSGMKQALDGMRPVSSSQQPLLSPITSTSSLPPSEQNSSLITSALPVPEYSRRSHKAPKTKWRTKKIIMTGAISLAVIAVSIGGWYASNLLGNVNKVFHGNVFSDAHALITGSPLKESNGRINILLAGNQGNISDEGPLTDSIMVVSLNPATKTGFILSIPRDLWVNIPSMGPQKINAANDVTSFNQAGYPAGGMGQLQKIVQSDLGIPIDYETLIDYSAFQQSVDAVGGINVNIQSPDPRGIYDPNAHIKLSNGQVFLNGTQALNLARARGDGYGSYGLPNSDFSRTMYQRKMLKALFLKAMSVGVLTNPVKVANLFSAFGNNIQTNLTLGDVMSLLNVSKGLNLSNLQSVTYSFGGNNSLLTNYTDPKSGQEALIPSLGVNNFSQLQAYYQQLSSSNPVVRENPTVTLLNASSVSGLAAREKKILKNQGFNVVAIANASATYPSTLIVDNSNGKKPTSDKLLQSSIQGSVVTSVSGSPQAKEATNYSSNFVIVLGQNWDKTQSSGNPIQ